MANRLQLGMRGVLFLCLLASLQASAKGADGTREALGVLWARENVWINDIPAKGGTAFFPGDVIQTAGKSAAVVAFSSGILATLAGDTEVSLPRQQASANLSLRRGGLVVSGLARVPARVSVTGTSVVVGGEGDTPGVCRIAWVRQTAVVIADRGRVEVHGAGPLRLIPIGGHVVLEAGGPQAAGQRAGSVSAEIPKGVVQHPGQTAEVALNINDPVVWQDAVRTIKAGRVRIALLDGSFLNVGANSTMRIVKHDTESQQTEVEFTLGRLRGEVVKLAKSGAKFEVRTQTAVIGVVGTVFIILAYPNATRVFCLEGALTVRNLAPAVVGEAVVHANQYTSVLRGKPPVTPTAPPTAQVQSMTRQTTVSGAPPGAPVTSAVSAARAGEVAGSGTAATLSGVAVMQAGQATSSLNAANATLSNAITAANAAASTANAAISAAGAAVGTATNATVALVGIQTAVASPSGPGCGCQ